jgi:putative ABC transport system substrate-binding protein
MTKYRRVLLAAFALSLLVGVPGAQAQRTGSVYRIGFLGSTSLSGYANQVEAFRRGLRDLGYLEGKNLVIEFRWAEGKYDRLPELAAELVRLKPDVLVTHGPPGALAAKRATDTIPIVVGVIGEAVAIGAVDTLARPGGNVTAQAFFVAELNAKRLEVLKEAFPRVDRVGVLLKRDNPANGPVLRTMEHTAQALKIQLHPLEVLTPADLDSAVADFVKGDADAIAVHEEAMLIAQAERIADLARKYRLPTIGFVEYARAGGLLALGVDFPDLWRRAAGTVDRILKGAKPADIPIEQATKFELMVNMKTARSLGLTIPATGAVSGTSSHRVTNFTPTPAQRVVPLHRTSFTILSLVGRAQPIRSEMQCSSEDFRDTAAVTESRRRQN